MRLTDKVGADFDPRPVYPNMEPAKEHTQEIALRLERNAKEKEMILSEAAEFVRSHGKEVEKMKNLMRRYGVES